MNRVADFFLERRHSFAFALVFAWLIMAIVIGEYWFAAGLFLIGIPLVGAGEYWWNRPMLERMGAP